MLFKLDKRKRKLDNKFRKNEGSKDNSVATSSSIKKSSLSKSCWGECGLK